MRYHINVYTIWHRSFRIFSLLHFLSYRPFFCAGFCSSIKLGKRTEIRNRRETFLLPMFIIFINCEWHKSVNHATNNGIIGTLRKEKSTIRKCFQCRRIHGLATTSAQIWSNVPMGTLAHFQRSTFFLSPFFFCSVGATIHYSDQSAIH